MNKTGEDEILVVFRWLKHYNLRIDWKEKNQVTTREEYLSAFR